MAAWAVRPPRSVTMAAARFIAGTKSGVVISATRTSPWRTMSISEALTTTLAGPAATPGLAAAPLRSTGAVSASPSSSTPPRSVSTVTARDWTMNSSPFSSAHSMS